MYFCSMSVIKMYPVALLLFLSVQAYSQIRGVVLDEEKNLLPGTEILLLPDSLGKISDANGKFEFTNLPTGNYRLLASFLGYSSQTLSIFYVSGSPIQVDFQLFPENTLLEAATVLEEHAKQENTLAAAHLTEDFFRDNMEGTFAKTMEKLPGVNAINVGVGIAKPVLRGLSANRIIVNQQGVKQESHQWGADHGLEIDQFDVERIEIIKGPASLQYGSDGLGGVINVLPGKIIADNTWQMNVQSVYKTNNQHWGGSVSALVNKNDWFGSVRFSRQSFADYRVPARQFTYNNYTLPIYDGILKNTAGREENMRLSAGLKRNGGITRLIFSQYSLNAGLFAGAVGIPRAYSLADDGNYRDLDVPRQDVDHKRISFHQTLIRGKNHLDLTVGYQHNLRREHSYPEFHSIPISQLNPGETLALLLDLKTISADMHFEANRNENKKTILGASFQHQQNKRGGFEFLLPDFTTTRTGAFALYEWHPKPGILLSAGIRADYGQNNTSFFRQWVWNSNEAIIDSLIAPITNPTFFNWSASFGSSLELPNEHWTLKANFGKSFRLPYPSETVSNGIHHGTFRHEQGTPGLRSEHGYQLDFNAAWTYAKLKGYFSVYGNYFKNYIYLGPTFPARFSPLPESGQIFQYRQDNAVYTGFELQWTWTPTPSIQFEQAADFVQSYNVQTNMALPFTPQPTLRNNIKFNPLQNNKWKSLFIQASFDYTFAAAGPLRIDRSERETPAYSLIHASAGMQLSMLHQELYLNIGARNLLNTSYLNHLSRYRLINVPEQGRNVILSIKWSFSGKID